MGAPFSCKFQPNGKNVSGYQHVPDQPEIILTEVKNLRILSNKISLLIYCTFMEIDGIACMQTPSFV